MLRSKRGELQAEEVALQAHRPRANHLEAEILPGDTLISIALRFNCEISEIKRLNKIDKENEIFAFRKLKVPNTIYAHNIILEALPRVHKSGQSSPNKEEKVPSDMNTDQLGERLLVASVNSAVITEDQPAATDPLLDQTQFRGYPKTLGAPKNDFISGDCELNWIALLFLILAICIIIPLIYVYIAYEHPEEFSHHSRYDDTDPKRLHHYFANHTKS